MTKIQKVWLWIFIAMFAGPEILWSPVTNFLYSFFSPPIDGYPQLFRNNFLFNYRYENLLKIIISIQLISTFSFFVFWLKKRNNVNSKAIFWTVLVISLLVCLVDLFVFYLAIIFNPSFF